MLDLAFDKFLFFKVHGVVPCRVQLSRVHFLIKVMHL